MKTSTLTPETTDAILTAAWDLIVATGKSSVGLAEIARAAGVTRQSLYLAFGNRAGLLTAMARRADASSMHARQMAEIAAGDGADAGTLIDFVDAWLRHLPEIYQVGALLVAAAATDPEAARVVEDRMIRSLLDRYRAILARIDAVGNLASGLTPDRAADLCWSLTHLDAWRHLVVERGWTPADFAANRIALVRAAVLAH